MKKSVLFMILLAGTVFSSLGRDFSAATRIDSIDREIAAARERLDLLDADYYKNQVWGRGRYTSIGFTLLGHTDALSLPREYTSFGLCFNQGTSYLFPEGKGFGAFIKVGLDVRWVDLELVSYDPAKRTPVFSGSEGLGGIGYEQFPSQLNIRRMSFTAGVCGIGPDIAIAPFSWANNRMSSIKINLYAHYQPAFGMCIYRATPVDAEGERMKRLRRGPYVSELGFVNIVDYGAKLHWSRIAVGVEFRHGYGRFEDKTYRWKPAEPFSLNGVDGARYRRTFSSTRFYLAYSF